MDPIHPIAPVPPRIPPVAPAPMIGRVDRDAPHTTAGEDRRRRRRAQPDPNSTETPDQYLDYAVDDPDGGEGPGLHIDVTA